MSIVNVERPLSWVWRDDETVNCRCLWNGCSTIFCSLEELIPHFDQHIIVLSASLYSLSSSPSFICPILECELILQSMVDLKRHLNMHKFHAHRQFVGLKTIMQRPDWSHLTSCGFAPSTPTRIVYEGVPMRCEWGWLLMSCFMRLQMLFEDILQYAEHVKLHVDLLGTEDRDQRNLLRCHWRECTVGFKNKANLRVHVRHHSGDKATACPFCGAFFASNSKLFHHLLRKSYPNGSSESIIVSSALSCSETQVMPSTAEEHGAGRIAPTNGLVCILCQKRYECDRLLREHCRRHIMKHKCDFCSVVVDSPSALHRHIFSVHAKQRNYQCLHCPKRFAQKGDLQRHQAIHSDRLEFACEICDEKFRWRKQLVIHARKHDKDYKQHTHLCHLCNAKYANGYGLSRHLVKKHNCPIPDGFTRFQYKKCADGFARLQTKRCLSKALATKLGLPHEDTAYVTVV
ncbi:unnamed protein product [Anisakis simplex]|uniref:Mizf protein, putative (inferred by orthology to a S. mansoni protein) n=1 Tax=Anisakis simplex TaxID=6269 RepID=A0A0M3JR62_ANISI|nr:unnamed protein product [Anisakis simplex]